MNKKKKAQPSLRSHEPPLFHEMNEYVFEDMTVALLERQPNIDFSSSYGVRGNTQFGIDVEAICSDNTLHLAQCKCEKKFGPSEIDKAAKEFLKHWDTIWKDKNVDRFILVVARKLATTKVRETLRFWRSEFSKLGIKFEDWDARQLETRLSQHEDIVRRFLEPTEFWLERLCGKKLEHTQVMSLGNNASRRFVTTSDVELILDENCQNKLETVRSAYACGDIKLAFEKIEALKSAQNWDAIGPEAQAQLLRLEANIRLLETPNKEKAYKLLEEADELFEAKHPYFFEAMKTLYSEGVSAAIKCLRDSEGIDEKLLLAQLLVNQSRINDAKDLINATHVDLDLHRATKSKITAEIYFLQKNTLEAKTTLEETLMRMPRHRGSYELLGIIEFYSACAESIIPDQLPYIPNPIDPLFIYRTTKTRTHLDQASQVFENLSTNAYSTEEKTRWQAWKMAANILHGDEYEKAAEACSQLLEIDRVNVAAITWGLSFNLIDIQQRRNASKALTDLVDSNKADTSHVLALCALKISANKRDKAAKILEKQKGLFQKANAMELWDTWALQTGLLDTESAISTHGSVPRKMLLSCYANTLPSNSENLNLAAQQARDTKDWPTLADILTYAGTQEQYLTVAENSEILLEHVRTEKAFELAVTCCSNANKPKLVLELFKQFEKLVFDKVTPPHLRRILVNSQLSLGLVDEARHEATTIAQETSKPSDFIGLANIQLGGRGDIEGAAKAVKEALKVTERIPKSDALKYARIFAESNTALSRKLLKGAHQQGLEGEELTSAFFTSLSLGDERLHKQIALDFFPKAQAGEIPDTRSVSLDDMVADMQSRHEYHNHLNQSYRQAHAPIHIIAPKLNVHLDDLFHFERARNSQKSSLLDSPALFAFSGSRESIIDFPPSPKDLRIYADLTSIFLAESLGCLDDVINCFAPIKISREFFVVMVNAITNKKASQPSRVDASREFLRAYRDGLIRVQNPDEALTIDASLIWHSDGGDNSQSNNGELLYCGDILTLLENLQTLSPTETAEIKDAKGIEWGNTRGAVKHLKSFATIHIGNGLGVFLAEAGILQTLSSLFNLIVSDASIQMAENTLIEHEVEEKQRTWLSKLSLKFQKFIDDGKIEFLSDSLAMHDEEASDLNMSLIRTILEIPDEVDAVWVDDRFFNSYQHANNKPFITLINAIEGMYFYGKIKEQRYVEILLELRKSNIRYASFTSKELLFWLRRAPILKNSELKETHELSILRRYINTCYADEEAIVKPREDHSNHHSAGEIPFILQNIQAATACAYKLWCTYEEKEARIRINWLLTNLLPETPILPAWVDDQQNLVKFYALLPVMLMTKSFSEELMSLGEPQKIAPQTRASFLNWVWCDYVLAKANFAESFIDTFVQLLTENLKSFISHQTPAVIDGKQLKQDEAKKLDAIVDNVWRSFVTDMPHELHEKLLEDTQIHKFMSRNSISLITIGKHQFEIEAYTSAINEAANGLNIDLETYDNTESFTLHIDFEDHPAVRFSNADPTKNMQWVGQEVYAYLPKASERTQKLTQTIKEYGWPSEEASAYARKISRLKDSDQRVRELLKLKKDSYHCWKQDIEERLIGDNPVSLEDLTPPNMAMAARYFILPTDELKNDRIRRAATQLAKEEGLVEAILRFSGLPIDILKLFENELSSTDLHKILDKIEPQIATPMHLCSLLAIAKKADVLQRELYGEKLAKMLEEDREISLFGLFVGLAHWFQKQFRESIETKEWSNGTILALSWLHANEMTALIIGGGREVDKNFAQRIRGLAQPKSLAQLSYNTVAPRDVADPTYVSPEQLLLYSIGTCLQSSTTDLLSDGEIESLKGRFILQTENVSVPTNKVWFLRPTMNELGTYLNDNIEAFFTTLGLTEFGAVFSQEWLEKHLISVAECNPATTDHWFWQLAIMTPYHQVNADLKEVIRKQILSLKPQDFATFSNKKRCEAFGFISSFACTNNFPELESFLTPILLNSLESMKDNQNGLEEDFSAIFNAMITLTFIKKDPQNIVAKFVECLANLSATYPSQKASLLTTVDWMLQLVSVEFRAPINEIRYKLMAV